MYKRFHKGLSLVGNALCIDVSPLTRKWSEIYEHRLKNQGKATAVKFMKNLNTAAERYALRQRIEPIPWTRSNKEGYPRILGKVFKTHLRSSDPKQVIMALSVMRTVEALMLPISKDISSVINPCRYDSDILESILNFIPQWVERLNKSFEPEKVKYHYTVKSGPNGPALHNSDLDISAVINDPLILEAIRRAEGRLGDSRPMNIEGITPNTDCIHSKLSQFPDKAGKTRTIAIIDYYSQRTLKPLHDFLMETLKSLVSDGTYSHQNVGKFAQKITLEKGFIYCADLTTFTDRFPGEIQRVLLNELIKDSDLSEAWWTLLAKRTFKLQWSDERVSYSCGQPMGAYASWALCSLAHHLVVEYSAFKAGTSNIKTKYRLIGDDVIITDRKTAQCYQELISALGVEINLGKTVQSAESSEYSGAEVAKQLYLNGICLTPLTPGFIRDIKKPYMLNACLATLMDRYEFISSEVPKLLIDALFTKSKKARQLAWLVGSNPLGGVIKPDFSGYDDNSPWASVDPDDFKTEFCMIIVDKFMEKSMNNSNTAMNLMYSGGSLWKDSTRPEPRCMKYVIADISQALRDFGNTLDELFADPDDLEAVMAGLDFIPDPYLPYMARKETRQKRISLLIQEAYDQLYG